MTTFAFLSEPPPALLVSFARLRSLGYEHKLACMFGIARRLAEAVGAPDSGTITLGQLNEVLDRVHERVGSKSTEVLEVVGLTRWWLQGIALSTLNVQDVKANSVEIGRERYGNPVEAVQKVASRLSDR